MESARQIEERASEWLLRRDAGPWTEADEADLSAWLDVSTERRVAFLRLQAGWAQMNRLKALGAGIEKGTVPKAQEIRFFPGADAEPERVGALASSALDEAHAAGRAGRRFAIAAGVVLAAVLAGAGYLYLDRGITYSTPVGGISTIPLEDGSHVTLNTESRMRVNLRKQERFVELVQGEAYFDVAKDPERPFTVVAAGQRIVAVGTAFGVRISHAVGDGRQSQTSGGSGDGVQVTVTEGAVRVEPADDPMAAQASGAGDAKREQPTARERAAGGGPTVPSGDADRSVLLTAGTIARSAPDRTVIEQSSLSEAEDALSWRSGFLVFHDTPLPEAVTEFNRYNSRKIRVDGPAAAGILISGKFRANNYEVFTDLLQETYGIETTREGTAIVLTAR